MLNWYREHVVWTDQALNMRLLRKGILTRIHAPMSVEFERLTVYLDSDITPWHISKPWEDLQPSEWDQVFKFGTKDGKPASGLVQKHTYILQPVTDVTICLSKSGYEDLLKLADNFSSFNQRLKYAHFRPLVPVRSDPRSWWKYAYRVVSDQLKKARRREY